MNKNKFLESSSANAFKTFLILGILTGFITLIGFGLSLLTNDDSFIFYALIIAVAQNVIAFFFGDKIALSMSHAQPAQSDKHADLIQSVEILSKQYELPTPKVYVINDPAPNAFATGKSHSSSSLAFTTGILATLDRGELEGVIAHELTHIKNRDTLVMTVVVTMSAVLSSLANMAMYAGLSNGNSDGERRDSGLVLMLIAIFGNLLLPISSLFIQSFISRKREFMADAGAAYLTGHPESLANALLKISGYKKPMLAANSATAHLYISNPFGNISTETFFQKLFMTHPPIEERIEALTGQKISA